MSPDTLSTLFKEFLTLLERLLVSFGVWYTTSQAEKQKTIVQGLETHLKANKAKEDINAKLKTMSDAERNNLSVIDD